MDGIFESKPLPPDSMFMSCNDKMYTLGQIRKPEVQRVKFTPVTKRKSVKGKTPRQGSTIN